MTLLAVLAASWPSSDRAGDSGTRSVERLQPAITAALDAGWGDAGLAAHLGANADGVKSAYAVLAARLDDVPGPPAACLARPPWCGTCHEPTRLIDTDTGAKRCPACHPSVARDNQLRRTS